MAMGLTAAINKYFGRKEGQSLEDFGKEIRALTKEDKEEFKKLLSIELKEEIEIRY